MYRVSYKKKALKAMARMPGHLRTRFETAFGILAQDPTASELDVKRLQGRDGYRLRIGEWRALYDFDSGQLVILVIDIGPRGDIYK
jgi:mRNA interferase RelE/StbE